MVCNFASLQRSDTLPGQKPKQLQKVRALFCKNVLFHEIIFFLFQKKKNLLYWGHWGSNCEFSFFAHKGMYINRRHFKWTPNGIKIFMKSHLLRGGWKKCAGGAKLAKLINVELVEFWLLQFTKGLTLLWDISSEVSTEGWRVNETSTVCILGE